MTQKIANPDNEQSIDQLKEKIEELRKQNTDLKKRLRETEGILKDSEDCYRSLIFSNESVKILIDPNSGRILTSNQEALRFYGYQSNQFYNLRIWELSLLTEDQLRKDLFRAKKGWSKRFVDKHRLANGEIRDIEISASPVKYRGKIALFAIIYDISRLKRAEEILFSKIEEHGLASDQPLFFL